MLRLPLGLLILIAIGAGAFYIFWHTRPPPPPADMTPAFASVLATYLLDLEAARQSDVLANLDAYRRGRVVVVDLAEQRVDALQGTLDPALRASRPDEVGTLVGLACAKETVGRYTDGTPAVAHKCDLWLVDEVEHKVVDHVTFGNQPAMFVTSKTAMTAARPDADILEYLQALPVR